MILYYTIFNVSFKFSNKYSKIYGKSYCNQEIFLEVFVHDSFPLKSQKTDLKQVGLLHLYQAAVAI